MKSPKLHMECRRIGVMPGLFVSWLAALAVPLATPVMAADDSGSSPGYHLLRAVPGNGLRALETDRPDQTESPVTVDAGHFQLEADLISYSWDDQDGLEREILSAPVLNLKAGLLPNVDLQVVLSPYTRSRVTDRRAGSGHTETISGFGDTQVRLKVNFWGNDSGPTALAMMPFVQFPTGDDGLSSEATEGGVIFPFGFGLPFGFDATAMWEIDFLKDASGGGYHADFVQSLAVGRDLAGKLSGYVEWFTVVSTERGSDWTGQFDIGFNYLLNPNLKLDGGVNIGVTASAPDWNPFLGVTWRY